MKKLLTLLLSVVLALGCCIGLTACNGDNNGEKEPIAALICLHGEGSSYDKNFIDAFKDACAAKGLTEEQYTIVVDIPEDTACYDKAAEFADAGYKVVFADSFGHEPYMKQAAAEFPEVQFCHATGTAGGYVNSADTSDDAPANFHNAFASIYEGRYLAGVAAGLKLLETYDVDKDGAIADVEAKIGYVGAWPFAEVKSGLTSFYLGVKSIVANVTMEVRFTNSWYDPVAEQQAATELINGGAKLVSGHADSYGVPTACKKANIPNVFYNGTTEEDTFVIASKINWQPYFEHMLDGVLNDKEIDRDYVGTLENGSVQITALGKAAAEGTQAKLDDVKAKLMSGEIKVFDCSTFTVNGQPLTEYFADVVDTIGPDGKPTYEPETNVIKTENGITYFAESFFRSAPYFDLIIDGITVGADVVTPA